MSKVSFWNGNKSTARQGYETALLEACLAAISSSGPSELLIDNTDYLSAEDEGNIFSLGADILVTVAGNLKFKEKEKIMIPQALAKGLLGYRLLILREDSREPFENMDSLNELRTLTIGIPETWADADLFRSNGFPVAEKGTYGDLFELLRNRAFDYTALGANEVESALSECSDSIGGLCIEPSILLYYPFPLVFYVHPDKPELAERVGEGLRLILESGEFDRLFDQYHGTIVERLRLRERKLFTLRNPIIPRSMSDFRASLLD